MKLIPAVSLFVAGVLAVVAISAATSVATARYFPQLFPQGPQGERGAVGARGPMGDAGRDGLDGVSAPADTAAADSESEAHLRINGRDLGTLSAAKNYCRSIQLDI